MNDCFSQRIAITYIFVNVHKILDIKILPYFYGIVRLATGYNDNLFKHLLLVLSLFFQINIQKINSCKNVMLSHGF